MTRTGRGRKCGKRKRPESKTHSPPVTHSPVSTIGLFFQDPEPVFDERRGGTGTPACAAHGQQCLGHRFCRPLVVPPTLPHIVYRRFFQEHEPVFDQPPGCAGSQPVHCTARSGCATCPAGSARANHLSRPLVVPPTLPRIVYRRFFQEDEPVFDQPPVCTDFQPVHCTARSGCATCPAGSARANHLSRPLVVPPPLPRIVYRRFFQEHEPVFDQPPGSAGSQPVHCTARRGCATCTTKSGCVTVIAPGRR